jgi:hypothetical protein
MQTEKPRPARQPALQAWTLGLAGVVVILLLLFAIVS